MVDRRVDIGGGPGSKFITRRVWHVKTYLISVIAMKILMLGINYAPELTGIGKYTGEMCSWLANQGHDVTVISAMPYYPEWKIHPLYRGKLWHKERLNGVSVYRVPLYVPEVVTSKKRILHELSFLISVFPVWLYLLLKRKNDVVINITPPFHLGIFSYLYAKLKGSALITHVHDLQIDAAKELGMIKHKTFLKWMFKLEAFILKNSDAVGSISVGMKRKIIAKGVPPQKYVMFPNWVDENLIRPLPMESSLRTAFGLTERQKVILYSGNLGEKQGLEILIDAAKAFVSKADIVFLVVGSGGGMSRLKRLAKESDLKNVKFFPLQPYENLAALLATADIHLVLQKKSAADLVLPSKLTSILAAGGCSLVTAMPGTSLYDIVEQDNLGLVIEPESTEALVKGINRLLTGLEINDIRIRARKYAELNLGKENILGRFEKTLYGMQSVDKEGFNFDLNRN